MKTKIFTTFIAGALILSLTSCSGIRVKKEAISQLKQVGLLTISVEKTGPRTPNNNAVIQAIADYAVPQIESKLQEITTFKLVPSSDYKNKTAFKNVAIISKSKGAQAYLKNKAETDREFVLGSNMTNSADSMAALASMFSATVSDEQKEKAIVNATNMTQKMLDQAKTDFAAPKDMPFLPYGIFNDTNPNKVEIKAGNANKEENHLKDMMASAVSDLCNQLNLDAMILVHVSTNVPPIGSIRVISGKNRVLGLAKLNMTMSLIDRKGDVIADLHWPNMDDLAPSKGYIPTHLITERKGKHIKSMTMDLKDPKGKVLNAFKELVVDSSGKMVTKFKKAIGEIK